jgi:hypothetical protein
MLCHHARLPNPAVDGSTIPSVDCTLVTPIEKAASGPAARAVVARSATRLAALAHDVGSGHRRFELLACLANQRRAFDETSTTLEIS